MCKQNYHSSIHCIRNRSIYVFVLRLIFRQRRLTCSLAKVFKQSTSAILKSIKNSPSPKPTTSSTTFRKSSHSSCLSSFFATFPYFSTFFSKFQLVFANLIKKSYLCGTYDHRFASCNRLTIVGIQNYEIHIFRNPALVPKPHTTKCLDLKKWGWRFVRAIGFLMGVLPDEVKLRLWEILTSFL